MTKIHAAFLAVAIAFAAGPVSAEEEAGAPQMLNEPTAGWNVYGPGQTPSNPYTGIMSLFCRMARRGESIPLYEDGEVRRDFVLIDDVAAAVVRAAVAESVGPDPIDIGSGETQTIRTAAELIAERYGAPEPHVTGQFRDGDVRHAWADVTDARERLGWEPRFLLREGVERHAAWIDDQPGVE